MACRGWNLVEEREWEPRAVRRDGQTILGVLRDACVCICSHGTGDEAVKAPTWRRNVREYAREGRGRGRGTRRWGIKATGDANHKTFVVCSFMSIRFLDVACPSAHVYEAVGGLR